MKNQLTCLIILGILAIFISSCSVSTTRIGAINPGYFKNAEEGNVSANVFVDNKGFGGGANGNYALSKHGFMALGADFFSAGNAADTKTKNLRVEDIGVKGFNASLSLGLFNNFGKMNNKYFESSITLIKGWQEFVFPKESGRTNIDFTPTALSALVGWGTTQKNVDILGGINLMLSFNNFIGKNGSFNSDINISKENFSCFSLFFGGRFGRGPIKCSVMTYYAIPSYSFFETLNPRVNASLGVHYNFGRITSSLTRM